ncbi:hypothetical protein BABINDRAFT_162660 [Babjeviella inositovora NRRL Y-12698]|uniref:Zinc finger CHCC-type domain-containing protein n=1 Tax=Babjeviella inositovora NRRL Y-12698 TaxID=984486 RepID=A0A1E3QLU2_9ASCO|nr:uncharacterized protein BABINDRAFT_162660 [Babjeviella inositovora NRRL Y-12698]ODQ78434.1 hypothetical protein BABINDRAFT_162660 [Babjeviella inositovora NRRL Y-12698]
MLASKTLSRQSVRFVLARSQSSVSKVDPKILAQQAPNRTEIWSESQRARTDAMTGPRFSGKDLAKQPRPYAAINLIAKQPIRFVDSNVAVCDGNKGLEGHPKIYINLDPPRAHACGYCGLKYARSELKAELEGHTH